jgi:hypothetical protein
MLRRYSPLFLLLGLAVGFTILNLITSNSRQYDPVRDHAITRTNFWGLKALAELCRQHRLPVTAWNESLDKLWNKERFLAIIDPCVAPSASERQALVRWVEGGGTLLLAVDLDPAHHVSIAPGGG